MVTPFFTLTDMTEVLSATVTLSANTLSPRAPNLIRNFMFRHRLSMGQITDTISGMETKLKKVTQRLKAFRIEAGLTQQQLADYAGIDRKTVNRIENGHFSPNIETLLRLCVVVSKKPTEVFEGI